VREIAVRMALGAAPRTVMAALVRGALAASLAGLAAGIVAALALAQALQALLYGVQPRDGAALAGAAALLLAVTSAAAWLPALRATRIDPVKVLRGE
jgi:ABC-type antimicrobial peptide transport system permease subunit